MVAPVCPHRLSSLAGVWAALLVKPITAQHPAPYVAPPSEKKEIIIIIIFICCLGKFRLVTSRPQHNKSKLTWLVMCVYTHGCPRDHDILGLASLVSQTCDPDPHSFFTGVPSLSVGCLCLSFFYFIIFIIIPSFLFYCHFTILLQCMVFVLMTVHGWMVC